MPDDPLYNVVVFTGLGAYPKELDANPLIPSGSLLMHVAGATPTS